MSAAQGCPDAASGATAGCAPTCTRHFTEHHWWASPFRGSGSLSAKVGCREPNEQGSARSCMRTRMTISFACAEYATEFNHRKVERGQINRTWTRSNNRHNSRLAARQNFISQLLVALRAVVRSDHSVARPQHLRRILSFSTDFLCMFGTEFIALRVCR